MNTHRCPGCSTQVGPCDIACGDCTRRLPDDLKRILLLAARQRHRDHQPYLDAITAARQWWADHPQDTP